jgi:hypothetical protein
VNAYRQRDVFGRAPRPRVLYPDQVHLRTALRDQSAPRSDRYPPRGLSRDESARYVGFGATKFDEMVADGRMPKPKRVDGRVVWDRLKLDMAFSDLPDDKVANPLDRMLLDQPKHCK